jgi:hypothetical protein
VFGWEGGRMEKKEKIKRKEGRKEEGKKKKRTTRKGVSFVSMRIEPDQTGECLSVLPIRQEFGSTQGPQPSVTQEKARGLPQNSIQVAIT